jgi:hypothetical protein
MRVATVMDDTAHEFVIMPEDLVSLHDWLDGQKKHRVRTTVSMLFGWKCSSTSD